jgi:hypothetical protein
MFVVLVIGGDGQHGQHGQEELASHGSRCRMQADSPLIFTLSAGSGSLREDAPAPGPEQQYPTGPEGPMAEVDAV